MLQWSYFKLDLVKQEPTVPQEYILKGVVNAAVGQENGSREHLKIAQQYFQVQTSWTNVNSKMS